MLNATEKRANLDRVRAQFADKGLIITPSFLRLETSVNGTFSAVTFNTLANQGSPLATEKRLNISDAFAIEEVGMFIAKAGSSTSPTAAELSKEVLSTFANPLIFTGSGEAANLQALYNSFLSLRVQQTVYIDSLPTKPFEYVPVAQQGETTAAFVNAASADTRYQISRDGVAGDNGFVEIAPMVILNGAKTIDWSLTLPAATNLTGTSSSNQVVLFLKGWLIQGGANFQTS